MGGVLDLISQIWQLQVPLGDFTHRKRPGNVRFRVVTAQASLHLRQVKFTHQVVNLYVVRKCLETIGTISGTNRAFLFPASKWMAK